MGARLLRCVCPRCAFLVVEVGRQWAPLVCPRCGRKFFPFGRRKPRFWVFGVLAFLVANLCAMLLR